MTPEPALCERCRCRLRGAFYEVGAGGAASRRCLRCTLTNRPLVVRSLLIAAIVGTLLTAINQGNIILQGDASAALAWKIPLTYSVPYCVANAGALMNSRVRAP